MSKSEVFSYKIAYTVCFSNELYWGLNIIRKCMHDYFQVNSDTNISKIPYTKSLHVFYHLKPDT